MGSLFLVIAATLLAVTAVAAQSLALPAVATQSFFAWSLGCKDAGASASWTWLQNGVAIGSGGAVSGCVSSGGGMVPSGANGITASLITSTACGSDSKSVTNSFDPSKGVSIKLSGTVGGCKITFCILRVCTTLHIPQGSADFSLSSPAGTISAPFYSFVQFQGVFVVTNGSLTVDTSTLTFSGAATVTATDSVTLAPLFTKTYAVPVIKLQNVTSGFKASFLLNVAVLPYPLSSDVTVVFPIGGVVSTSVSVTRQVDINLDGTVNILDVGIATAAYGSTLGSSSYNPRADLNADGIVNILDISLLAAYYQAPDLI